MFQTLSGISIGQGAGVAFGGGIYAAQAEIGFSAQPTRVTLNVVSESGQYQAVTLNTATNKWNINLNGKIFTGMYLYSYEKNRSPGASVMTVNFVDSSIMLDKIFIGLLNRHGNKFKQTSVQAATFTVRCITCTQGLVTGLAGTVNRYVDSIPVNNGCYFEGNTQGGYIILGKENFSDSNCEIPKVDYNFTEFCNALDQFLKGSPYSHELRSFDRNSLYRQEYAGTLREVLNNWASDFGFEFYFDGNVLKGIDLRSPININFAQSFADKSEFVSNASYGESLENSYLQTVVARFLKPSEAVEYSNNYAFKQVATPLRIESILKDGKCAGRGGDCLLTSIALARLDPTLRESYIANWAIENNDTTVLQALGFTSVTNSTPNLPYQILGESAQVILKYLQSWQNDFSNNVINANSAATATFSADNYVVYFGYFREDLKSQIESWDNEARDFIGKYYSFVSRLPTSQFSCPRSQDLHIYYNYNSKWESLPSSNTYAGNAVPFASLLRDPISSTNYPNNFVLNLFTNEDNGWGIEPEEYLQTKGSNNYEFLKPSIVKFNEFPVIQAGVISILNQIPVNSIPSNVFDLMKAPQIVQGAEPSFLIIPRLSKLGNLVPRISSISRNTVNRAVFNRASTRNSDSNLSQSCLTFCDENIVSEICNCGASFSPVPYFINFLAPFFLVSHPNGNVSTIVFPVESAYFGFFINNRIFKTTYPPVKAIYGTPPANPTNAMSVRVIDYDITPDIEAVVDNNDAVNQYIYSSTTNTIMSATAYYNALSALNNLIVPPQKTVKISVARSDVQNLGIPLTPASGLTAMNINISDGGVQTELTYSTRPPSVPKPEAVYAKVKYRLYRANK